MCGRCVKVTCRSSSGLSQGSRDGLCWGMSTRLSSSYHPSSDCTRSADPTDTTRPSGLTAARDSPSHPCGHTSDGDQNSAGSLVSVKRHRVLTCARNPCWCRYSSARSTRTAGTLSETRSFRPENTTWAESLQNLNEREMKTREGWQRKRAFCEFQVTLTVAHERTQHPEWQHELEHQSRRQQVWVTQPSGQQNLILQIMHTNTICVYVSKTQKMSQKGANNDRLFIFRRTIALRHWCIYYLVIILSLFTPSRILANPNAVIFALNNDIIVNLFQGITLKNFLNISLMALFYYLFILFLWYFWKFTPYINSQYENSSMS